MSEQRQTPETDHAAFPILSPMQSGTEDVVRAELARRLERQRDELAEALRELRSAVTATYPSAEQGEQAQDWVSRKWNAIYAADALLARIDAEKT